MNIRNDIAIWFCFVNVLVFVFVLTKLWSHNFKFYLPRT